MSGVCVNIVHFRNRGTPMRSICSLLCLFRALPPPLSHGFLRCCSRYAYCFSGWPLLPLICCVLLQKVTFSTCSCRNACAKKKCCYCYVHPFAKRMCHTGKIFERLCQSFHRASPSSIPCWYRDRYWLWPCNSRWWIYLLGPISTCTV